MWTNRESAGPRVTMFAVIAGIVLVVSPIPVSAQIATPTSQSLCDMPQYRGTAIYNKYCGGGAVPATGGRITPQQQIIMNGTQQIIQQGIQQLLNGNAEEEAARRAAAEAMALAAAEQQRLNAERAAALKSQLLGVSNETAITPSSSLMGATGPNNLQIMTVNQSPSFNSTASNPTVVQSSPKPTIAGAPVMVGSPDGQ